jgi:hypothetical protein
MSTAFGVTPNSPPIYAAFTYLKITFIRQALEDALRREATFAKERNTRQAMNLPG